jgi:uncharacterized protein YjbI with pentapeptide repeats
VSDFFRQLFGHCAVEALRMRWLKSDQWKAGIAIAGMLPLLVLMVWVPVEAVGVHERASGLSGPGTVTVQATPTEDATVTALNKEKLAQEVQQLKNQNEPDLVGWLRTNASTLLSTLVVVIGGLIGLGRWLGDRRSEREKRVEERFQTAVTGLGDDKEGAKIGAAILLRTFLRPGYEQFYTQTFDLAVANLRLPRTPHLPEDPNAALPLTTLSQVLIVVFKEAFPLARGQSEDPNTALPLTTPGQVRFSILREAFAPSQDERSLQSLDATAIQLDNAYLSEADLKQVWMPQASLRKANLSRTNLNGANLNGANLNGANLSGAMLISTNLSEANLSEANLNGANLNGANLSVANLNKARLLFTHLIKAVIVEANLSGAKLSSAKLMSAYLDRANLSEADLSAARLSGASLHGANLSGANLSGADLNGADLSKVNLEDAQYLKGTDLRGVKGLPKEQLEGCKAKGAIVDEDSTIGPPQSTGSPPLAAAQGSPISSMDAP